MCGLCVGACLYRHMCVSLGGAVGSGGPGVRGRFPIQVGGGAVLHF